MDQQLKFCAIVLFIIPIIFCVLAQAIADNSEDLLEEQEISTRYKRWSDFYDYKYDQLNDYDYPEPEGSFSNIRPKFTRPNPVYYSSR